MSWNVITSSLDTSWVFLSWQLFDWWEYATANWVWEFSHSSWFLDSFIWLFKWIFLAIWPFFKWLLIIVWVLVVIYIFMLLLISWRSRVEKSRIQNDITPEHKEFKEIWKEIILSNMYNHWSIYDEELEKQIKEDTILDFNIKEDENKKVIL